MAKVNHTQDMFKFDLIDARMVAVKFQIRAAEANLEENISIDTQFTVEHALIDNDVNLRVGVTVNISGENSPFDLDATYAGIFKFHSPITDKKQVEYIAEINCASILFPFLRETVADIIRRAGFAPLLLPPINFVDVYSKNHPDNI